MDLLMWKYGGWVDGMNPQLIFKQMDETAAFYFFKFFSETAVSNWEKIAGEQVLGQ